MNLDFSDTLILIQGLKNGDTKAYNYLVDCYHQRLCAYAYGLTNDSNLAKDIVQNVFIRVWSKRLNLKDEFSLNNYLYKSVYNEFIDQFRKKKSVMALEKEYIDALNTVVEEEDKSLEKLINLVKKEIECLPPKCKRTFILSKKEGLTNIEISDYLNVSVKSVEAHITKAFSILRKSVGDKVNGILFLLFGTKTYRESV